LQLYQELLGALSPVPSGTIKSAWVHDIFAKVDEAAIFHDFLLKKKLIGIK